MVFPEAFRDELIAHAREGDPDEVCGVLAGHENQIERVRRIRNTADQVEADRGVFRDRQTDIAAPGRRAVHYFMDPLDLLQAYNEIEEQGLDVVGYYHSHTHTEARPSPTDVRLATDLTAYLGPRQPPGPHCPYRPRLADLQGRPHGRETGEVIEIPFS